MKALLEIIYMLVKSYIFVFSEFLDISFGVKTLYMYPVLFIFFLIG